MDNVLKIGSVVRIKSDPNVCGAITNIIDSFPKRRIDVFINGSVSHYYDDQIELKIEENERSIRNINDFKAFLTSLYLNNPSASSLYSLHSARINYIPFQFRPVVKIIKLDRPRILIADEVGIGKTIEAGLILKELSSRIDMKNVIVICPKPLVVESKWKNEMERFDESFKQITDSKTLKFCFEEFKKEEKWPEEYSRIIVPYSLLNDNNFSDLEKDSNLYPQFDLVIVDEAHRIKNPESKVHKYVKIFTDNSEAVIFLTATPIQIGSRDLFALLRLLRSDLYYSLDSLEKIIEPNSYINNAIDLTRNSKNFNKEKIENEIRKISATSYGDRILSKKAMFKELINDLLQFNKSQEYRVEFRRKLEQLNTLSNIINRTRRIDIGEFTKRRSKTVESEFSNEERNLYEAFLKIYRDLIKIKHDTSSDFFISMILRQASSSIHALSPFLKEILEKKFSIEYFEYDGIDDEENEDLLSQNFPTETIKDKIEKLLELSNLLKRDTKLEKLETILAEKKRIGNVKIIIFSSFLKTLDYLFSNLSLKDYRLAKITGKTDYDERIEINKRFRHSFESNDTIDILLLSDVGCEGLDYEFCDTIINYDIPWNPMKIEQRIGRIDRYGQNSEAINIFNLIVKDTIDAEIYNRCLIRIGVFKQSIGGIDEILGDILKPEWFSE